MASGDGGDIEQYRALKRMRSNPDWRYNGMSRRDIENTVKARSSILLSKRHSIPQDSGRGIKFSVTNDDIEHLIDDAIGRANGVFFISDIQNLHRYFGKAKFVKRERDTKHGNSGVHFNYYEITVAGRKMYLNIKEDRKRHRTTLYSITKALKEEKD